MNRRQKLTGIIVLGIVGLFVVDMVCFIRPVSAAGRPTRATNLLIFSWGSPVTPVLTSLGLDRVGNGQGGAAYNYTSDTIINATDLATKFPKIAWDVIDVVIVDGYLPNDMNMLITIMNHVNGTDPKKRGLLFFGGNYSQFDSDAIITKFSEVLPADFVANREVKNSYLNSSWANITGADPEFMNVYGEYAADHIKEYNIVDNQVEVSINAKLDAEPDFLFKVPHIAWGSCPLLKERIQTYAPRNVATDYTVVEVPSTKEPLIIMRNGTTKGRVMFFSPGTTIQIKTWDNNQEDDWNKAFALWPYFNYMMYLMVRWLDPLTTDPNNTIESYAEWPFSPIPHFWDAVAWMSFVAGLWIFNFILFFKLGRSSRKRAASAVPPATGRPEGPAPEVKPEGAEPPIPPKPDVEEDVKPKSTMPDKGPVPG